jgi:hypothetical protein
METSFGTRLRRDRRARLTAALLPLPALLAPAPAHAGTTIAICSAEGERLIRIPAQDGPSPRPDDRQGCAHFVCPRERGHGEPADDDEE